MSLTPTNIIADVAADLNDVDHIRWTQPDLINYLNSALRQLILVRPDANVAHEVVTLVSGTKQTIPASGFRLLDMIRNMGADGLTPGKVITLMERADMDALSSGWHFGAKKSVINNFSVDDRDPTIYYVNPPVTATVVVTAEIVYSKAHTEVTSGNLDTPLSVQDLYQGPLMAWMKSRAFSRELSSMTSQQLAAQHKNDFYTALGIKTQADTGFSPNGQNLGNKR